MNAVIEHRRQLESYIRRRPDFLMSLKPISVESTAPLIVRRMGEAATLADVGPMAAVGGAIADLAVEAAMSSGAHGVLVEDGGEISIDGEYAFTVAIGAGESPLSYRIGFRLSEEFYPIGIATSSATVGHALSFGIADAATVVSRNATLADAFATKLCNSVNGRTVEEAMKSGIDTAENCEEILGALIIIGDRIALIGDLPPIVKIEN